MKRVFTEGSSVSCNKLSKKDKDCELPFDCGNMDVINDFDHGGESWISRRFRRVGGERFEIAGIYSSFEQFC